MVRANEMQAIILAGGLGTRLQAVVSDLPKPMAPIRNKPFLACLLDYLSSQGIRKVILSVGYKHEVIKNYFGNNYHGVAIEYSVEESLLGTGGAIKKALTFVDGDLTFVINGDSLLKADYQAMLQQQKKTNSKFTLALKHVADIARYGAVKVEDNHVVSFLEKGGAGPGLINTGVYLCSKAFFNSFTLPDVFSIETDFLHRHLDAIKPEAFIATDYFIDIGIPEDYLLAQTAL